MSPRVLALFVLGVAIAARADAKSHEWRITEIFSDASGMVQFIELTESAGAKYETLLNTSGFRISTVYHTWLFPHDLEGVTAHRSMLVASPAFAALPDAPTPDFVIDGSMFPDFFWPFLDGVNFGDVHKAFSVVILEPALLPQDGILSLHVPLDGGEPYIGVNSPTNFAGETSSVSVGAQDWSVGELRSGFDER